MAEREGGVMNEQVWNKTFRKYIECYEAVQTLKKHLVIDDDFYQEIRSNLLDDIIVTFKSEVE